MLDTSPILTTLTPVINNANNSDTVSVCSFMSNDFYFSDESLELSDSLSILATLIPFINTQTYSCDFKQNKNSQNINTLPFAIQNNKQNSS